MQARRDEVAQLSLQQQQWHSVAEAVEEELKPALRRLGLQADTDMANAILEWYDHDESGKIELYEFAVMARDIAVFTTFDADHNGTLDASELRPALTKLGLAASKKEPFFYLT